MGDSNGLNKDQLSRQRDNNCQQLVGDLLFMILGDNSYFPKRNWEKRMGLVKKAMGQLENPQFTLERLRSLMQPIIIKDIDVKKAESAFQELHSLLQRSNNIVMNQNRANEICESLPDPIGLNQNGVLQIKAMQEAKVESQGIGAELKQMMAILDQKHQSMREAKVYTVVANMLQKVVNSCLSIAANDILIQEGPNQVQGHNGVGSDTFEIKGGQLRLNFPPTTDFFQINQKGKNAEVHNQEMIDQEKQVKELILTIGLVAGRLAELKLAMKKTSQEMDLEVDSTNEGFFDDLDDLLKHDSGFFDLDNFEKSLMDVTGTSNAAANKTNVMLSRDKTCFMENNIVLNCNASVVAEIFQEHPYVAENFLVDHPDSQSFFINSLAEVYRKIKSEPEMLELEGIKSMELKVKDMERVGLQLSWLKEMLAGVSESLEDKTERKRLLEEINSYEEKSNSYKDMAKEAKQKLAKLEKKPRFR